MKSLIAVFLLFNFPMAFAADCSQFPNAKYEEYWGYNRALSGRMMCASYGMSKADCDGRGGDFKNDSGSGYNVCFLDPSSPATKSPAPPDDWEVPPLTPIPPLPQTPAAPRPLPQPETSETGSLTFRIQSKSPPVNIQMYSSTRKGWTWPTPSTFWILRDGEMHDLTISCQVGEYVCYGGWTDDKSNNWGVGYQAKLGCGDCCLTCEPAEKKRAWSWVIIKK